MLSRVRLFATPWTVTQQVLPSMGFSRQEYWSGLPFPSPGDLPNTGIEPRSSALQADALTSEPPGKPIIVAEVLVIIWMVQYPSILDAYPLDKEILLCPEDIINWGFYVCKGEKFNSNRLKEIKTVS